MVILKRNRNKYKETNIDMICLAITITLNYTKVFRNISMLICKW